MCEVVCVCGDINCPLQCNTVLQVVISFNIDLHIATFRTSIKKNCAKCTCTYIKGVRVYTLDYIQQARVDLISYFNYCSLYFYVNAGLITI